MPADQHRRRGSVTLADIDVRLPWPCDTPLAVADRTRRSGSPCYPVCAADKQGDNVLGTARAGITALGDGRPSA